LLKILKNTIGLKDDQDIDVRHTDLDSTEVWGSNDELISKISEKMLQWQLKLNKLINEQLVDVSYSSYLPKFYLFGQYALQTNENDGQSLKIPLYSAIAGIGLTWDLNLSGTAIKKTSLL
jgi:hypothetical protein